MKCPCFHDLQSCGHVVVCLWLLCVTVVEHNIGLMRNTCWSYPYVTLILMVDLRSHGDDQEQPSQTVILPLHDGQYCRMLCIIWEYKCRSMWQAVPYVVSYCGSVDMDVPCCFVHCMTHIPALQEELSLWCQRLRNRLKMLQDTLWMYVFFQERYDRGHNLTILNSDRQIVLLYWQKARIQPFWDGSQKWTKSINEKPALG